MTLLERITDDVKTAMKSGDTHRRDVLRLVVAALKNEAVALQHPLSDLEAEAVLARMKKQLTQSAEEYTKLGDAARAAAEAAEATIVAEYLPTPLTDDELQAMVNDAVAAAKTAGEPNLGAIIQAVKQQAGNQADGGRIAALVRAALA